MTSASKYHTLLLENERVRVLDTRIRPGETTPLHTHRWPSLYHVLSWGEFVRRDQSGNVLVDSRAGGVKIPPQVVWAPPMPPHTLENVGSTDIHVVSVEVKESR